MSFMRTPSAPLLTLALLLAAFGTARPAAADSGLYVGGSVGQAALDFDQFFDEDDTAWKLFGGYNFDVAFINLAVEASYTDFGSFGDFVGTSQGSYEYDASALSGFGVAGLDLGFIGFFAKAGFAAWDADGRRSDLGGSADIGDDGFDPAYGIGARLTLWSIEFRAEYEYFDIDLDGPGGAGADLSMFSLGAAWTF
jgi:hypothetical protein